MEAIIEYISTNQQELYIFILAIFVGVEVISKVPTVLHTPLMSGLRKNQVKNKNHDFTDNRYLLPDSSSTFYRWYQDDESSGFCA